jgi:ABC-2 type transport system permease protein
MRRSVEVSQRRRLFGAVLGIGVVVLHLIGYGIVRGLSHVPADVTPALILPLLTMAVATLLTMMTAQALSGATRAFFENGASGLLLAAPVSPARLFAVRALALAITTTAPFALFILPVAHVGFVVSGPRWLALYAVLASVGLVGTALGLILALGLVRALGARVSRSAGQIVAVLIGTSLGFGLQHFNRMPTGEKIAMVDGIVRSSEATDGWAMLIWTPGLALHGDGLAVGVLLLLSTMFFAACVGGTAGRYLRVRQDVAGMTERSVSTQGRPRRARFAAGPAAALRRKEWRLLTRDPWILMPVLQRAIALVPVCLTLSGFNARGDMAAAVVAPMLVVFAGKLAGGISWLTLAGEEAPEQVLTAPVPAGLVRRAKLEAALTACGVLFALPLALLAWRSLEIAGWAALGCIAATLAATLLALAEPKDGRRRSLQDRFRTSVPFVLAELLVTMALAAAVWMAVSHWAWPALLAAVSAAGVLGAFVALMRPASRGRAPTADPHPAPLPAPQALSRKPS